MRLRFWALILADLMLILHVVCLVLACFEFPSTQCIFYHKIPTALQIAINILVLMSLIILYIGSFQLNVTLLTIWLGCMLMLWQIPLVIIMFILFSRHEAHYKRAIFIPSLYLCIWTLAMIKIFKFRKLIIEFRLQPKFIRTEASLMRQIIQAKEARNVFGLRVLALE